MREVEGRIERIGGRGDGIMQSGAERIYVPYTVPGDRIRAGVGKPRGDGFAGVLLEILAPGPERREPPCPHFHACGGCSLQQLSDSAYAAWKRDQVVAALQRRGLETEIAPLVRIPPATRRRADFVARRVGGGILLGFHEAESHRIVGIEACPVLTPALVALATPLREALAALLPPGGSVDLKATLTDTGIDLLIGGKLDPGPAARARLAGFAEAAGLARLSIGEAPHVETVAARRPAALHFGGVAVVPPPGGFVQASREAEQALLGEALDALAPAARIADLFAGCGTFTLPLVQQAKHRRVHAVEGDQAATDALRTAVQQAGLAGRCTVERRDLARRPLTAKELKGFDAVLFDPPRAGAREQAAVLAAAPVGIVVGISCAPASFARDARLLVDGGFALRRVVPVDQFLWSPHVELAAIFAR